MSVCGPTEEDSTSEEQPAGKALREMYEQKAVSKVVRVLTVLAYLLSVSLAAILLSVYYVCVWKSPVVPPLDPTDGQTDALHADPPDDAHILNDTYFNETRGGNSTVSGVPPTPPPLTELPSSLPSADPPDPTLPDYNSTWLPDNVTDTR